jgi:hypothetical protein
VLFAEACVPICQAEACGVGYANPSRRLLWRFACRKRFRVDNCLAGWRRQRLPLRRPRWSHLSQPRHKPWAWIGVRTGGPDGVWAGKYGVQVAAQGGLPGAPSAAAPCNHFSDEAAPLSRPRHHSPFVAFGNPVNPRACRRPGPRFGRFESRRQPAPTVSRFIKPLCARGYFLLRKHWSPSRLQPITSTPKREADDD